MDKKGQVLIIILWILAILTVLAVTLGHSVSMGLKMSSSFSDGFLCNALANAGLNRAIEELENDKNTYDSLKESWADNETVFSRIVPAEGSKGFASVGYKRENGIEKEQVWGMVDEERKININISSLEVLTVLLERYDIPEAARKARNILIWRGSMPDTDKVYDDTGYPAKGRFFQTIEELKVVKGLTAQEYEKIKDVVTVYGTGLGNINTVSADVLLVQCRGIAAKLSCSESLADGVADKVFKAREAKGFWLEKNEITVSLTGAEEENIFNNLLDRMTFSSSIFLIEAAGNIGKIKKSVTAVYNRKKKEIVYRHEN